MSRYYPFYVAAWALACVVALVLLAAGRGSFALVRRDYWRFLAKPWKIGTFLTATGGLTAIAPYTGDPTWDYVDSIVMSVLTYLTAPWAVGAMYKVARRRLAPSQGYVAACVWMFTASWFYDLYILLRDGIYPGTWASNIVLSSILYAAAGMMWNLDWREGRGVFLAFVEEDWPSPNATPVFDKIFWWALPLMALAAAMMVPFLWKYL